MKDQVRGRKRLIADKDKLERFEMDLLRRDKVDHARNLAIVNAMWKEAVAFGAFPPQDPMEGIEVDLRIAKVVNGV